jgi:phosphatidylglycerol---prolipoprotein diacylglyceryl transferase
MTGFIAFPSWISPVVIPGLPLRWYGIMYLVAIALTFVLFQHEMRRNGNDGDRDQIADFFFWTVFGLLLGGRLLFVVAFDPGGEYLSRPWMIVWPFKNGQFTGIQGMSYHGGLAGAIVAAGIYARVKRLDVLEWGDTLAVCAPLGYTFGRLGNFINGELTGRVTAVRWGVLFPTARRYPAANEWVPAMAESAGIPIYDPAQLVNLPRHPSQLYEALLEGLVLWLVLWFVVRKRRPFKGALLGLYVVGYGIARFMAGYFRETDEARGFVLSLGPAATPPALVSHGLALTEGQIISLSMIVLGFAGLVVFRLLHKPPLTVETFH